MPDLTPAPTYTTKEVPSSPLRTSLVPGATNQRLKDITVSLPKDNELAAAVVNPSGGDGRVFVKDDHGDWSRNR